MKKTFAYILFALGLLWGLCAAVHAAAQITFLPWPRLVRLVGNLPFPTGYDGFPAVWPLVVTVGLCGIALLLLKSAYADDRKRKDSEV